MTSKSTEEVTKRTRRKFPHPYKSCEDPKTCDFCTSHAAELRQSQREAYARLSKKDRKERNRDHYQRGRDNIRSRVKRWTELHKEDPDRNTRIHCECGGSYKGPKGWGPHNHRRTKRHRVHMLQKALNDIIPNKYEDDAQLLVEETLNQIAQVTN